MHTCCVNKQAGVALVMALVMLVVLTLLAVTTIRTSSLNMQIAQNTQLQQEADGIAQAVLEGGLSSMDWFNDPDDEVVDIRGGYTTTVLPRNCMFSFEIPGCNIGGNPSLGQTVECPERALWEVRAQTQDASTGARAVIGQAVRIDMLVGCN